MAKEIWKDIEGYVGLYQVSDKGRIRRQGRTLATGFKKRRKILSAKSVNGYQTVSLCKDGVSKIFYVHRLIAEAFIPNPENKPAINHINGDRADNRIQNLEWVTFAENSQHAFDTGLASNKRCRKLTFELAEEIRREYNQGALVSTLAAKYNMDRSGIKKIIKRQTYKKP